jgi:hypothetical protein
MKLIKALSFGILIGTSGTIFAGDNQSVFVGYDGDSNKKYITWDSFYYGLAKMAHSDSAPKEISKHVLSCVKSMSWGSAEFLSYNDEEGMKSYKFKFNWMLRSKFYSVDVDGGTMTCRKS